jgi:hypothetical protein
MINWPIEIKQNKYTRWYERIIEHAKKKNFSIVRSHAKKYPGYTEVHHIIPKSFGGSDNKENLVRFSAREHFICHWLLTKMTTGTNRNKMLTAFVLMTGDGSKSARYDFKITSSRVFEQIRIDYAKYVSEKLTGREISQETRNKLSIANTGKKHTDETRARMSSSLKGKPGPIHTPEGKAKIGNRTRGKTFEELYGKEQAEALKEKCKNIGEDNGFYGKTHSEETLLKFAEYHNSPEVKKAKSERVKGDKNPAKRPEVRSQISQSQKERLAKQKISGTGYYSKEAIKKRNTIHKGAKNGNAKIWEVTTPNNQIYIIEGSIKIFCKENGISFASIGRLVRGEKESILGWKARILPKTNLAF